MIEFCAITSASYVSKATRDINELSAAYVVVDRILSELIKCSFLKCVLYHPMKFE